MTKGRLAVAILWHQHQPMYRSVPLGDPRGSYLTPWVRLHAVRDYYPMAALLAEFPEIHLTINLVPSLIVQLEDYLDNGATDQLMELCLTPTGDLTREERDLIVARCFDANWRNEIRIHPRYAQLLGMMQAGETFRDQDITDLKAWFNLAWFPPECRRRPMDLPNGERVTVSELIRKSRGFSQDDVASVIREQYKIMRNVLPMHRRLMESGQLEISVSPFYHPILPLVADTDRATIDADGSELPERFSWPDDARSQIEKAVLLHRDRFGVAPKGMWPSEGCVAEHVVHLMADAGLTWMATDRGVLEKSGEHGYDTENPDVLLRPYKAGSRGHRLSVFFRHTRLSDDIGFSMQGYADYDRASDEYVGWIREGFARRVKRPGDRILSIILDGENAWGSYRNNGRAFLRGLYGRLSRDPELVTVTFNEFLEGNASRGIRPHPRAKQKTVSPLYAASWIDEMGSPHGNDMNIWIGSPEENTAWNLLGMTRRRLDEAGATPESHPEAFESIYVAEGSDWFWWYGDDFVLPPGAELTFDLLFRERLKDVYRHLGEEPPDILNEPIAKRCVLWAPDQRVGSMEPHQLLRIIVREPGDVRWTTDGWATHNDCRLMPAGDVMANLTGYGCSIGPFDEGVKAVEFRFRTEGAEWSAESHSLAVTRSA
jgi:alpha-amylase/alpha-mannosidase (GH57 family)